MADDRIVPDAVKKFPSIHLLHALACDDPVRVLDGVRSN